MGSVSVEEPTSQQHFHPGTTPSVQLLNRKALMYRNGLKRASPRQEVGFQVDEKLNLCHEPREPGAACSKAVWMCRLQNYKLLLPNNVAAMRMAKKTGFPFHPRLASWHLQGVWMKR